MTIKFPIRSRFIEPLRFGIKGQRSLLDRGRLVEVRLDARGYYGRHFIRVDADDRETFEVEGTMKDTSRFPQRMKAAALALFLEEAFGRFEITVDRESGIVTIKRDD